MVGRRGARAAGSLGPGPVVAVATVLVLALSMASPAAANGNSDGNRLTLMTRNLYLGSSLAPALTATTPDGFVAAVAQIYATQAFTNFPVRAQAIAAEIDTNRPDLVGLQEVSVWQTAGAAAPPSLDYLQVLSAALASRGLNYEVAATSDNADIGPVPLLTQPGCTTLGACSVTLKDRDVILVNADRDGLQWSNPQDGSYATQQFFQPPIPGAPPVSFDRGWASIDGSLGSHRFHYASTHLETEDFPGIQEAQAAEFLAGPAHGPGADLATGDFNSAADGSTTTSYALLTSQFKDAWRVNGGDPGMSCCQNETLSNPVSQLGSRIDLVLFRNGANARSATLVGAVPFQSAPPLWPSDHAGVVATLRIGG